MDKKEMQLAIRIVNGDRKDIITFLGKLNANILYLDESLKATASYCREEDKIRLTQQLADMKTAESSLNKYLTSLQESLRLFNWWLDGDR